MEEYIQTANYRAFLTDGGYRPIVHRMQEDVIGSVREPLWILLGTMAMVLLVACGNVANLCLVRAESRQREIAVRIALGGQRGSLMRKMLVEAFVMSAVGSGARRCIAAAFVPMLLSSRRRRSRASRRYGSTPGCCCSPAPAQSSRRSCSAWRRRIRYTRPDILGWSTPRRAQRDRSSVAPARASGAGGRADGDRADAPGWLGIARPQLRPIDVRRAGIQPAERADVPRRTADHHLSEVAAGDGLRSAARRTAVGASRRRGRRRDDGAAGEQRNLWHGVRDRGTATEGGQRAPDRPLFDGDPGIFRGAARAAAATAPTSIPAICAKAFATSSSTRQPPNATGRARTRWKSGFAIRDRTPIVRGTVVKGVVADVRHDGLRQPARPLFYFPSNPTDESRAARLQLCRPRPAGGPRRPTRSGARSGR